MRFRILFFSLFFFFSFCFSREEQASVEVVPDSTYYTQKDLFPADSLLRENYWTDNATYPKNFKPNFRNSYKNEDFNYTTIKPHESLWERIKRKLRKLWESIFGKIDNEKADDYTNLTLRFLAIVVIGFLLYFIIRYLASKDGNFFFSKKNKKINIPEGDIHEDIHEINFPETIAKYEREKDFRMAVRYRFLQVLKNLSDKKMIDWNIEKTNKDYVRELKSESQKHNFEELAYIFDYVWYGEFEINEKDYQHFKEKFENSNF